MSLKELQDAFANNKIDFETFIQNPKNIISDHRLVIQMDDQYYNWGQAGPIILSLLAFK